MKRLLSVLIVVLAGLVGLALVFTDLIPVPLGPARVGFGGLVFLAAGFGLARLNATGRPLAWALAAAWGPTLLGVVGAWISVTDPASGDVPFALMLLLGPLASSGLGGWVAGRAARPAA